MKNKLYFITGICWLSFLAGLACEKVGNPHTCFTGNWLWYEAVEVICFFVFIFFWGMLAGKEQKEAV